MDSGDEVYFRDLKPEDLTPLEYEAILEAERQLANVMHTLGRRMYACILCGSEWPSRLAAAECCDPANDY